MGQDGIRQDAIRCIDMDGQWMDGTNKIDRWTDKTDTMDKIDKIDKMDKMDRHR